MSPVPSKGNAGGTRPAGKSLPWSREGSPAPAHDRQIQQRRSAGLTYNSRERRLSGRDEMSDAFVVLETVRDDARRIVDFVYQYANAAFATMIGRSVDDLVSHRLLEVVPNALDTRATFEEFARVIETNEPTDVEIYQASREVERWYQRTATPLRDLLLLRYRDVSAPKREERRRLLLIELVDQLSGPIAPEHVLERLPRILVGRFADCAFTYVSGSRGRMQRVGVDHTDPSRRRELLEIEEQVPPEKLNDLLRPALRHADVVTYHDIYDKVMAARPRDDGLLAALLRLSPRSAVVAPVLGQSRTYGVVVLATVRNGQMRFDAGDLDCIRTIARLVGRIIDGSDAAFVRTRPGQEGALLQATTAILATSSLERMMEEIAQNGLLAIDADGAVIEYIENDRKSIRIAASTGLKNMPVGGTLPYSGTLAADLVETGQPRVIPRLLDTELNVSPALLEACGDCSVLAVPLVEAGQAIGALLLLRRPGRPAFEEGEIGRASVFANLASLAFRKVHLLEEARRQREELREITRLRERLVRGFSHDLKNPLGAARGHLDLLQMRTLGNLNERQVETVRRIRAAVDETLGLIDEALEAAQAEAGHSEAELESVSVTAIIKEVVSLYRAQAREAHLALDASVSDKLPTVDTDATRVRQILGNLVSNAIKYTPPGGRIDISVAPAVSHKGGFRWIAISVKDTGIGIPKERHGELFREFQRVAKDEQGSGIGLAMSQRLARVLGGGISVESDFGMGSTFTLWLPAETPASLESSPWRIRQRQSRWYIIQRPADRSVRGEL